MKTFTTLLLATVASVSINANAGSLDNQQEIWSVEYEQWLSPSFFNDTIKKQDVVIVEDTGQLVWSEEYEEWINPADFNPTPQATLSSALKDMQNNPAAAGSSSSIDSIDSIFGINAEEEYKSY